MIRNQSKKVLLVIFVILTYYCGATHAQKPGSEYGDVLEDQLSRIERPYKQLNHLAAAFNSPELSDNEKEILLDVAINVIEATPKAMFRDVLRGLGTRKNRTVFLNRQLEIEKLILTRLNTTSLDSNVAYVGQLVDILGIYGSAESSQKKLVELLFTGNKSIEDAAAYAIKNLEFRDAKTLSRLVEALTKRIINGRDGSMLEYPLWRAQGNAIFPVLKMLEHDETSVKASALDILSLIDRNLLDEHSLEEYRNAIARYSINKDVDPFVRRNALKSLANLAIDETEALTKLVHIATEKEDPSQHVALYLLSKSKVFLTPSVASELVPLLGDDRYAIRIGAFIALRNRGLFQEKEQKLDTTKSTIEYHAKTIESKNTSVTNRITSASAIRGMESLSNDEVQKMINIAFDQNESGYLRYSVATNLIASGIDQKFGQNMLRKITTQPDDKVMVSAMNDAAFRLVTTKNYLSVNDTVDPTNFDMTLGISVGSRLRTPEFMSVQNPEKESYQKISSILKELLTMQDADETSPDFRNVLRNKIGGKD